MTYVMNILDIAKNRGDRGKIFHCLVLGPLLRCTNVKLHLTCMVFIPDLSYHYKTIPAQRLFLSVAQCRNFLKTKLMFQYLYTGTVRTVGGNVKTK